MSKQPKDWPAAKVELRPINKIFPYERNPRTHPPEQITLLAASMLTEGVTMPILVDEDGFIIAGHGRRLAAIENGFEKYPVVVALQWSEAQKQAARIKDNSYALLSGWDRQLIQGEVQSLAQSGYDVKLLGLPEGQLLQLTGRPETKGDPEHIPTVPKKITVRLGDVWHLGGHRLMCGDATDAKAWQRLFGQERAAMVFTDPPYGVSYQAPNGEFPVIEGDHKRSDDLYRMLVHSFRQLVKHADAAAAFYIWHASGTRNDFAQAMATAGISERQYLIWVKPSAALGHADYQWEHEPCFYASRSEQAPAFYGDRAQTTVWRFATTAKDETAVTLGNGIQIVDGAGATLFVQSKAPKGKKVREFRLTPERGIVIAGAEPGVGTVWQVKRDQNYVHPTQKPVELALVAINNSSKRGQIVADAFGGSGTTMIAAEVAGRRAFLLELDPQYAEVIIRRWQEFTGSLATLETGETLDEIAKARRPRKPVRRQQPVAPARAAAAVAK